ncbi:hypothetical protein MVES1_003230 [Malassezia vespertilionis]|uniref:Cytoplasmic tRNA 2-thiolation protein 2 n=1 Tax=Malassezia vespertilionis TaxID=2020962 RepID=A0A2N1J9G1_9BASI|nr:uncharacterized protein MVES1_003230 [Malassezia vespertilionis]PKI83197.1 hypothetical protein MVES_003070 [Malassezia vespertilionis]WFD07862.1 hypothetical protein MVES1_003230 [Malassezia vespertilionis]
MADEARCCARCRKAQAEVHVREQVYCAGCYARVFAEKVRFGLEYTRGAILQKSVVRPWEQGLETGDGPAVAPAIAIAYSGGLASTVLLHAVSKALSGAHSAHYLPARAPEMARIDVLYVQDGAARAKCGLPQYDTEQVRAQALRIAPHATFACVDLAACYADGSVDCVLERDGKKYLGERAAGDAQQALRSALDTLFPASTSRTGVAAARTRVEDLHKILMHHLLRTTAMERGCAALMYADDAVTSASALLEGIANGAGHKLPIARAASQWWVAEQETLLIVHPLHTILPSELVYYAQTNALGPLYCPTPRAGAEKHSIGALTHSLVASLQDGVSSTVSTIAGTGSKLVYMPDTLWPTSNEIDLDEATDAMHLKQRDAPRIGAKGMSLVASVQTLPRWDPSLLPPSCPLCHLPAKRDAAAWRAQRSVTSSRTATQDPLNLTPLHTRLCYTCLHVLQVPSTPTGASSAQMPLPLYVLNAMHRPEHGRQQVRAAQDTAYIPPEHTPHIPGGRASHALQPVSREAMHDAVQAFLL